MIMMDQIFLILTHTRWNEWKNSYLYELIDASSLDQFNMTENWLEYDRKNSHRHTLTLEHDQKFTPMNINLWTWLKYGWIWKKLNYFGSYIFGHVLMLRFIGVNFLVMFIKFGHIHSVILICSSEYSFN